MSELTIVSVYPELLGTYGDSGNVLVLQRRLQWRGIQVRTIITSARETLPTHGDLYVIGGSEDDAQTYAVQQLRTGHLARAITRGAHVFAVCAGLQLLGTTFQTGNGHTTQGLDLLDLHTTRLPQRVVGEVIANLTADLTDGHTPLTGFANHAGGSTLGPDATPLATVRQGHGNLGATGDPEGATQGTITATYLHGPILARNPTLADRILQQTLHTTLPPLPHNPADQLHQKLTTGA